MLHVTLVDDDVDFCEELAALLNSAGFHTNFAHNYIQLQQLLERQHTDLIVLDIGLPGDDGFAILQHLQPALKSIGVVMLTARGEMGDRVRGLISGADAYLVKPVDLAEISATLHAVARRLPHRNTHKNVNSARWRLGKDSWVVISPAGEEFALTAQERTFLRALVHTPKPLQTVSREILIEKLGRSSKIYETHFIDALVSRLRNKLGPDFPLQTVRGLGYALSEPVDNLTSL
ncbi:MAG TPA: response regulator transcription factor [Cellvibrionaceae bacterium]